MKLFMNAKKDTKKTGFFALLCGLILICAGFISCTSEIDLTLKKDGSVDVKFSGEAGVAFTKLILSASGLSEDDGSGIAFDTQDISYELTKNGFSDVKVISKKGTDLTITMTDKEHKSALFTSKVLSVENNKLKAVLSAPLLKAFYDKSDENIVMFLDMLLAPVFNDEEMSQNEYLEVMGSFYGSQASDELKDSCFKITFHNPDGSTVVQNIPMAQLLSLQEIIQIK